MSVQVDFVHNVGQKFASIAAAHSDRRALTFPDGRLLTYGELAQRAVETAQALCARGIGRGDVVAIFAEKAPDTFATMLACLRLGAPYVVLDVASPAQRLERILARARPKIVVADRFPEHLQVGASMCLAQVVDLGGLRDGEKAPLPDIAEVTGADPAYLMFTSGSTGFPKGAVISHQNMLGFNAWAQWQFSLTPADVLTNVNPLYFDNSVFDFTAALLTGASLVPVGRDDVRDARRLVEIVEAAGCTVWFSVPSLLVFLTTMRALGPHNFPRLRAFVFGGEGYPKAELKKLHDLFGQRVGLWNVYGPTECTCICSAYLISERDFADMASLAPLGRMAPNFSYLILDEDDQPADEGRAGELCLMGPQVGLGYYNDPERTADAFISNPCNSAYGQRTYRTGDWVVERDGLIYFLGRKDNQIKHMGYRIELEEVEAAINGLDYVRQAAVVYLRPRPAIGRLVAAVVAEAGVDADRLRQDVGGLLPAYMVPSDFYFRSELPKNANGKVDRLSLAAELSQPS